MVSERVQETRLNSAVDLSVPNWTQASDEKVYPAAVGDTTPRSRQIFVVKKQKVQSGLILDNSGRN